MADKIMHHVVIGGKTYEIVDEQGRAKAATNTQDITALKEDFETSVIDGNNLYDTSIFWSNDSAITNNGDGGFTVGTGDYGRAYFGGGAISLKPGVYSLYGVPWGSAYLSTNGELAGRIASNENANPKTIVIEEAVMAYLCFRAPQAPSTSYVIRPFLYGTKIEENAESIAVIREDVGDLKSAIITNNAFDLMTFMDKRNVVDSGLDYTWNNDGSCTISGTSTAVSWYTIYAGNISDVCLEAGKEYYLKYSSNSDVFFRVYFYTDSTLQTKISEIAAVKDTTFTVPENCTYTIIRIWISKGKTVNETVHPYLLTAESNQSLSKKTEHFDFAVYNDTLYNSYQSASDISENAVTFVSSTDGQPDIADVPFAPCWLITMNTGTREIINQIALPYNEDVIPKRRYRKFDAWTEWKEYIYPHDADALVFYGASDYASCDDIVNKSIYFVSSSGGVLDIPDAPFIGWLQTIALNADIRMQIMYPYNDTDTIKYRSRTFNGWSAWKNIGSSSTITITEEVSRDTYNNTYNITTTPTITVDANGWLQPVDTNTADETNKTDMTGAIMSMLTSAGYCHLAPGIYYVSGNIDMPADSMLEGCGKQTIIRLLQSTTSGYIVRMHTRSTVKNVCFSGSYSTGSISDGNIGGRRGINYIGNRDGQSTGITPKTCTCCVIDGCYFENLDSGIYGYNSGGGLQEGLICNNCYFTRCKAGINLDYWVEYSKFTNCITFQCYYGCINNGGNNVFTACTFHGVIGFLIDNSSGSKSNVAHGTVNGCTFNHIDNMNNPDELGKGYGVKVLNTANGFIFSNCQFWYGRVHIENSTGIQLTGCEFGGLKNTYPVIETTGNGMVFVDNCLFQTIPTNDFGSPAKLTNCWTYSGNAVVG